MSNVIYTQADYTAIMQQQKKRWLILSIPCAILAVVVIISFIQRVEWLTSAATVVMGALLIAGYDLFIKPLHRYELHLKNCLQGRNRECELPFIRLSENIDVVEGVQFHQLLCADVDGKGRPYERLFYFDALKDFPAVQEGDMLHIVYHDLTVSNVYRV